MKNNIPPIDLTICIWSALGLKIESKPMNPYQAGEKYFKNSYLKPVLNTIIIIKAVNDSMRAVEELSANDEMIKQSPIKHPK